MRVRGILTLAVAAALAVPISSAHSAGPNPTAAAPTTMATPLCGQAKPTVAGLPRVPDHITVATFNMLHGLTTRGDSTLEARLKITIDQIARSGVDIVGLQEVEESAKHGLVIDRVAKGLAAKTNTTWYWCWFRTEPHWPGAPDTYPGGGDPLSDQLAKHYNQNETKWYEGAAVLSWLPITAAAVHRLPGEDFRDRLTGDCKPPFNDPTCIIDLFLEPRAAVWARVWTAFGPVSFTSAHTSGNVKQHADLMHWARLQSAHDSTAFVACDCNSTPSSPAQAEIRRRGWVDTALSLHQDKPTADQDIGATKPTVTTRIDYVFIRADSAWKVASSRRFMNTSAASTTQQSGRLWPSDHYGVIDTITR
jgi:endonuclease/exonuclease/phosphatase family metal-dependent hydrolase